MTEPNEFPSALQGQISVKLGAQNILSNSSSHLAEADEQVGAVNSFGPLRRAYSLAAHTRDNLLFPIASIRAMSGKLSMHFDPGDDRLGLAVQFVP